MTTLPPAENIDWNAIALWAGGIATVLGSIAVAIWKALGSAVKVAKSLPGPVATDIYTTDSSAITRLTAALEAANVILTENNVLRREEHADRAANRARLEENTDAMRSLATAIAELRIDIRELTREVVRGR